jgi:hypothetical protein
MRSTDQHIRSLDEVCHTSLWQFLYYDVALATDVPVPYWRSTAKVYDENEDIIWITAWITTSVELYSNIYLLFHTSLTPFRPPSSTLVQQPDGKGNNWLSRARSSGSKFKRANGSLPQVWASRASN